MMSRLLSIVATVGLTCALAAIPAGAAPTPANPDISTDSTSRSASADCPAPNPATPKRQLRAMWIASVVNIDWPSKTGLTADAQKAEFLGWLDVAQRYKFNAVVVQVRPTADAFWPSPYEPWSAWLTGTQGQSPGYDPLDFVVAEAHKRNLEVHAWFNPYRVSMQSDPAKLSPSHPGRVHPDWILPYGGKLYYNPGIPEVRRFVEDAMLDAVKKYDIDGVHWDDYFYPYPVAGQVFDDDATYAKYGSGFPDKASWRRNNIDLLVSELSGRIKEIKPLVKFGISPFAVWRNIATDPEGSDTKAGVQTYDDLFADTRKWVREGWIDYIVPQIYWNIGFAPAAYDKLIQWWSAQIAGTDVQLYVGEATYKVEVSTQDPAWKDPREMTKHLLYDRDYPVSGNIYFSAKDVRANRLDNMNIVASEHYTRPALLPVMRQLPGRTPHPPVIVQARSVDDGARLSWVDTEPPSKRSTSYAIYRFDGAVRPGRCDFDDASALLTTVRGNGRLAQSFTDTTVEAGKTYTYVVTALDRTSRESAPSPARAIRR